jgi:hypothetical protein
LNGALSPQVRSQSELMKKVRDACIESVLSRSTYERRVRVRMWEAPYLNDVGSTVPQQSKRPPRYPRLGHGTLSNTHELLPPTAQRMRCVAVCEKGCEMLTTVSRLHVSRAGPALQCGRRRGWGVEKREGARHLTRVSWQPRLASLDNPTLARSHLRAPTPETMQRDVARVGGC